MTTLNRAMMMAGAATLLMLGTNDLAAQGRGGRGGFDPEQMRARMMERYKEALEVNSDAEWKIIEARIQKVMDARRDVGFGFGRGFGRRPGGPGGPGGPPEGDRGGDRGGDRRGFGGEPNPEAEALQKAIDAKAPANEIKAALAKYREARKQKEAVLEAARQDLKKVLSVRQEAVAVTMGLVE